MKYDDVYIVQADFVGNKGEGISVTNDSLLCRSGTRIMFGDTISVWLSMAATDVLLAKIKELTNDPRNI